MADRDAYRLLGITPDASQAEVRAAFRRKVMQHHPDTAAKGATSVDIQGLVDAYRLLMDPESRSRYDAERRRSPEGDVGSGRVQFRDDPMAEGVVTRRKTGRRCERCRGTGLQNRTTLCPGCRGASRVTFLDSSRARVAPCRTCGGRGQVRAVEACGPCDGRGVSMG